MEKALGLVEVKGLSSAVEAADVMVKAANVTLVELEAARGSGMMTVKVTGDVGAVRAAVEAGRASAMADGSLVSVDSIARPNEDTARVFVRNTTAKQRPNFYGQSEEAEPKTTTDASAAEPTAADTMVHEAVVDTVTDGIISSEKPTDTNEPSVPSDTDTDSSHEKKPLTAKKTTRRTRRTRNTKKAKTTKTTSPTTPDVSDTDTTSHT